MDGISINATKPQWLTRRIPGNENYSRVYRLLRKYSLHSVCEEAKCPNIWECFSAHTATFLIMGSNCTRDCHFCAISHGPVKILDKTEPMRLANAAKQIGLKYVVITSVTRDDLKDGGSSHFAKAIKEIRKAIPEVRVEVLVPDFQGSLNSLITVLNANPDVLNHNIETVESLYRIARPQANYQQSLNLIRRAHAYDPLLPVKSGLMLGLGEKPEEVLKTLEDLLEAGCRILTLGQYLQPSKRHLPVVEYISPTEFDRWQEVALRMGFLAVASGPFVRSSYHANQLLRTYNLNLRRNNGKNAV